MKGDIEKEFEYMNAVIKNTSTADLIAELEKRSQCDRCVNVNEGRCDCIFYCRFNGFTLKQKVDEAKP